MRAANPWTPERIAILEQLWAEGTTAQSIAGQLGGVSRSAVLGKIFRLRAAAVASALAADQQTKDDSQNSEPKPARAASEAPCDGGDQHDDSCEAPPPVRSRGKNLFELANETCRWPYGRPGSAHFHFCGAPGADLEGGMPYCAAHARRAYRKIPAISEIPKPLAAGALNPPQRRRRYVWRAAVRHPAARWK